VDIIKNTPHFSHKFFDIRFVLLACILLLTQIYTLGTANASSAESELMFEKHHSPHHNYKNNNDDKYKRDYKQDKKKYKKHCKKKHGDQHHEQCIEAHKNDNNHKHDKDHKHDKKKYKKHCKKKHGDQHHEQCIEAHKNDNNHKHDKDHKHDKKKYKKHCKKEHRGESRRQCMNEHLGYSEYPHDNENSIQEHCEKKHSSEAFEQCIVSHGGDPVVDPTPTAQRALILYDAPIGVPMQKLGLSQAIMLKNLLGHFVMDVEMKRVAEYSAGEVESYDALFYLGNYYNNTSPSSFLSDISMTNTTVVWFKYNIWDLAWNATYGFNEKFGINLVETRSFNSPPSPSNLEPGFFDTVMYKDLAFKKFYTYDANTQVVSADPDIGVLEVSDSTKASAVVDIVNSVTGERVPYITNSSNFWYVADIPFSFIGPRDRYLVFSDMLHDILNMPHEENHRAMIRFEDISSKTSSTALNQLSDYLSTQQIPFTMAVVPIYKDPLGTLNGGVPEEIPISEAPNLLDSLQYAIARGGHVLMHGLTHQYSNMLNPTSGVTADDYEFWDVVNNKPVAEDSVPWAANRIQTGLDVFASVGIEPYVWETPHYQGSPNSYAALGADKARYERSFYYTSTNPQLNLDVNDPERDFSTGQFFPFIIESDHYGQKVLPENLGNFVYDIGQDSRTVLWDELYENAKYALVVRDGFASFYFHPFWLEPGFNVPALEDLNSLVEGINGLGYQWVAGKELLNPEEMLSSQQ
jgi:uncharacterized protein YdaL